MPRSELLTVERVAAKGPCTVARVRVAPGGPLRTSGLPGVSQAACNVLPGLARHRCDCGFAHGIVAELSDTELPHLLEHIALELLALAGSPRTIVGETSWDFARDGRGVFYVAIRADDQGAARAALCEAAALVNALAARACDPGIVRTTVERIAAARTDHERDHESTRATLFDPPMAPVLSSRPTSEQLRVE